MRSGFSLLEVVLSIALFGVIVAVSFGGVLNVNENLRLFREFSNQRLENQNTLLILKNTLKLSQNIRINNATLIPTSIDLDSSNRLNFFLVDGEIFFGDSTNMSPSFSTMMPSVNMKINTLNSNKVCFLKSSAGYRIGSRVFIDNVYTIVGIEPNCVILDGVPSGGKIIIPLKDTLYEVYVDSRDNVILNGSILARNIKSLSISKKDSRFLTLKICTVWDLCDFMDVALGDFYVS